VTDLPIYKQIAAAVRARGACSTAEIAADLPHLTPTQIRWNLKNASARKLIYCAVPHHSGALAYRPATWVALEVPAQPSPPPERAAMPFREMPVTSVWDCAQRAAQGRPFWKPRVPRPDFPTQEAE
jgi:hypothetical protein